MLGKTHVIGGAIAFETVALAFGSSLTKEEAVFGLSFCIIGALAPDIDHSKSRISKSDIMIGTLSQIICTFTKHRGITHTPLGCFIIGLIGFASVCATVKYANANAAFMFALLLFVAIHLWLGKTRLGRFGGLFAIVAFFEYSKIAVLVDWLPSITLPTGYEYFAGLCFFAGAVSHLVLDIFNPEGVMLFYPFKKRVHLASITTGTKGEMTFNAILLAVIGCGAVRMCFEHVTAILPDLQACL